VTWKFVSFPWVVEEITLASDSVDGINFSVASGFSFEMSLWILITVLI